jgi:hypothetical protein
MGNDWNENASHERCDLNPPQARGQTAFFAAKAHLSTAERGAKKVSVPEC